MAIDDLLNEHEQGERVRGWLRRNAGSMLAGLAVGLVLIWGWRFWQDRQVGARMGQAQRYEALLDSAGTDPKALAAGATRFPADSMYGALARLQLAKVQVDNGQPADALTTLRGIRTADAGLKALVDVRTARLLIETGKPADAARLLQGATTPSALEALGDAQAKLGQAEAARAAYTRALTALEVGSPERALVEFKLADVGGSVPGSPAAPAPRATPSPTPAAVPAPAATRS